MKLTHPLFSSPIVFHENRIPVLAFESPVVFRNMVLDLTRAGEEGDGECTLSKNDSILKPEDHIHIFMDFTHLSEIDKRMQTKAIQSLAKSAQEQLSLEIHQLSLEIRTFLSKLATLSDFPAAYEESENLTELLKAMDFRVDLSELSPVEALYEQICLVHRLAKNQLFVLVNAKSFFSSEELTSLYKMTTYNKINLMLLESHIPPIVKEYESVTLFDKDLCELTLENPSDFG